MLNFTLNLRYAAGRLMHSEEDSQGATEARVCMIVAIKSSLLGSSAESAVDSSITK